GRKGAPSRAVQSNHRAGRGRGREPAKPAEPTGVRGAPYQPGCTGRTDGTGLGEPPRLLSRRLAHRRRPSAHQRLNIAPFGPSSPVVASSTTTGTLSEGTSTSTAA